MKNYKRKLRLNDVKSVNNLMARVINSLIDKSISEDEARAYGYLANILYKGLEQAENEELNKEESKAKIDYIIAKTNKVRAIGEDIEDIEAIRKLIYSDD